VEVGWRHGLAEGEHERLSLPWYVSVAVVVEVAGETVGQCLKVRRETSSTSSCSFRMWGRVSLRWQGGYGDAINPLIPGIGSRRAAVAEDGE
jgi:hypothetical protein